MDSLNEVEFTQLVHRTGMGSLYYWASHFRGVDAKLLWRIAYRPSDHLSIEIIMGGGKVEIVHFPSRLYSGSVEDRSWCVSWYSEEALVKPFFSTKEPDKRVMVVLLKSYPAGFLYSQICYYMNIQADDSFPMTVPLHWVPPQYFSLFHEAKALFLLEEPVSKDQRIKVGRLETTVKAWVYTKVTRGFARKIK